MRDWWRDFRNTHSMLTKNISNTCDSPCFLFPTSASVYTQHFRAYILSIKILNSFYGKNFKIFEHILLRGLVQSWGAVNSGSYLTLTRQFWGFKLNFYLNFNFFVKNQSNHMQKSQFCHHLWNRLYLCVYSCLYFSLLWWKKNSVSAWIFLNLNADKISHTLTSTCAISYEFLIYFCHRFPLFRICFKPCTKLCTQAYMFDVQRNKK